MIIPDSVTEINVSLDDGAFEGCQKLERVVIGDGLVSIASETFRNCVSLTSVVFGNSVKTIGTSAFSGCTGLLSVTIGEAVQTIGNSAFYGCTALADVTFGASVRTINSDAFKNCTSIQSIDIPSNVQTIGTDAFEGCAGLTTLILNEGLQTIGGSAFYGCPITELIIPDSVTEINVSLDDGAFEGCQKLERVVIGDGLVSIASETFRNCVSLTSVVFGNSVKTIGNSAFRGCSSLTDIDFGRSVQTISGYAFADCTALETVTIPATVQTIDNNAFYGCLILEIIRMEDGVQTIGASAFANCTALESVTIPASVCSIGNSTFQGCTELSDVTLQKGRLKTVGNNVFKNCSSIKRIYYGGTASDWEQISVSETNQYPLTVTPYYYSETEPCEEGNYWFFGRSGEETVWNVTENAYRSDIYTDEFVGPYTTGASYAGQCIAELSSDLAFVASFTAWETLHIVTTPSYAFESGAISRKDLYKLAIFDVLGVQEVGVPLIFEACDTETFSYLVEIAKEAFDDTYHVDMLKQLDAGQFKSTILASDTLENIGVGLEIFSLLIDKAENAYDAILLCARYIAITNLGDNFEVILTDIANDTSNASDMRAAARECVEVMRAGCNAYLLEMVKKEFIVDEIQTIAGFIIDTAWGKLIEFIPGAGTVMLIGKGLRVLGNELFNMDGKIQAYYQLDAAVRLEKAIKRMVLNREPDYLRCDKTEEAGVYVNVIQMYKKTILKGYDYSIDFYSEDGAGQGKLAAIEAERDALEAEFEGFEQGIDERYDAYLLSEPAIA